MSQSTQSQPVKFDSNQSRYFEDGRLGIFVEALGPKFDMVAFAKLGVFDPEGPIGMSFIIDTTDRKVLTFPSASAKHTAAFIFIDVSPKSENFLDSVLTANQALQKASYAGYPNIRVLPNWYGAGADYPVDGPGGGGPGEPAQEATFSAPATATQVRQMLHFNLPSELGVTAGQRKSQPIDVFILDSVPWDQKQTQVASSNETQRQPRLDTNTCQGLVQQALNNTGLPLVSFDVVASNNNVPRLPPENMIPGQNGLAVPDRHDPSFAQEMYDHGLFIAGIVYSMAQDYQSDVRIHLIETTNAYGVTSYEAILDALNLVQTQIQNNKLPFVINMSLVMLTPVQAAVQYRCDTEEILTLSYQLLADIFQENEEQGVLVASAGNNNMPVTCMNRPDPLFPAAAQGVIGVGALTKDLQPADYSNQADYLPTSTISDERIWTFGGDYDPTNSASYSQGMLGVSSNPNWASGLQWWVGTSFACGVVSGTLAIVMSQKLPQGGQTAKDYLFSKCTANVTESQPHSQITPDNLGRLLKVTQG